MAELTPSTAYSYTEYVVSLPAARVQKWVADGGSNHGIAIVTATADGAELRSSEYGSLDRRPRLDVTFVP